MKTNWYFFRSVGEDVAVRLSEVEFVSRQPESGLMYVHTKSGNSWLIEERSFEEVLGEISNALNTDIEPLPGDKTAFRTRGKSR